MRRRGIKLKRGVAAFQIHVDQHHPTLFLCRQSPSGIDRDRGRADAAADAQYEDELSAASICRFVVVLPIQNVITDALYRIANERLKEVLRNAGVSQLTVKNDIVPLADRHDVDFWLTSGCELTEAGKRVLDA